MAYAEKVTECKKCIFSISVFNKTKVLDKMLVIFIVVYYQRSYFFLQQTETINEIHHWSISKNNQLWVHSPTVLHIYNITPTPKVQGTSWKGKTWEDLKNQSTRKSA